MNYGRSAGELSARSLQSPVFTLNLGSSGTFLPVKGK